ncbi:MULTISPECIES: hypothetical protein [unclassified Streptomyces]|uniref:hypothetical protein n=1 Tax=unclassified Streptomyces TaxID=2593676 RepID=UPI0037FBD2EF
MTTTPDGAHAFLTALKAADPDPPPATSTAARTGGSNGVRTGGSTGGAPPPAWLWRLARVLHAALPPDSADGWAVRLAAAPYPPGLRAAHRWQETTVLPLLAAHTPPADRAALAPLGTLHGDAARGTPAAPDTWRAALEPALRPLFDAAYDRPGAYAEAHRNARAYAVAAGHDPAEADAYGHAYARLSIEAGARDTADAHAEAVGRALAHAYATDCAQRYADSWPDAHLRAVLRATAASAAPAPAAPVPGAPGEPRQTPVTALAEGLLTALGAAAGNAEKRI